MMRYRRRNWRILGEGFLHISVAEFVSTELTMRSGAGGLSDGGYKFICVNFSSTFSIIVISCSFIVPLFLLGFDKQ